MWLARWTDRDPGVVMVDDGNGRTRRLLLPMPPLGDRPLPGMLRPAGWSAYPGSEWRHEGPRDSWECAVYPV